MLLNAHFKASNCLTDKDWAWKFSSWCGSWRHEIRKNTLPCWATKDLRYTTYKLISKSQKKPGMQLEMKEKHAGFWWDREEQELLQPWATQLCSGLLLIILPFVQSKINSKEISGSLEFCMLTLTLKRNILAKTYSSWDVKKKNQ